MSRTDLRKIDKCKACEGAIVWCETSTGARMPVDAAPSEDGNVILFPTVDHKWVAMVLSKDEAVRLDVKRERHKSHFATCPAAARFRRPKKATPR